jgi:hypothetical protein
MNAHTPTRKRWDYHSGVTECRTCEGRCEIPSSPYHTHPNDPDNWGRECPDCDGRGFHECSVCGFEIVVPGDDCFVCFNASHLPEHLLTDSTAAQIGAALAIAFAARVKAIDEQALEELRLAKAHLDSLPADRRAALGQEWAA